MIIAVVLCVLKCYCCHWSWTEARRGNFSNDTPAEQYAKLMNRLGCFNVDLDTVIHKKLEDLSALHPLDAEAIHQYIALKEDETFAARAECDICGTVDMPAYYMTCCWRNVWQWRNCWEGFW